MLIFAHSNLLVRDLTCSIEFYKQALSLKEVDRKEYPNAFMAYLTEGTFTLELRQFKEPIDLKVDKRLNHIAFYSDDFEADLTRHKQMNCVDRVLEEFGLYFIHDPDGHSIEIMKKS